VQGLDGSLAVMAELPVAEDLGHEMVRNSFREHSGNMQASGNIQ
jgi:hypothetical protein